jgi:hypothetical protein
MIRSWRFITMTGNAQPLFGDLLTAAFSGTQTKGLYQATVADTTKYAIGDRVIFGFGGASATNILLVDQLISATVLGLQSEGGAPVKAWPNTTQLCLSLACAQVTAQGLNTNAANGYVGSDSTVTNVPGGSAFGFIGIAGSWAYGLGQWNIIRTSDLWIAGTASDKFGVSAVVI